MQRGDGRPSVTRRQLRLRFGNPSHDRKRFGPAAARRDITRQRLHVVRQLLERRAVGDGGTREPCQGIGDHAWAGAEQLRAPVVDQQGGHDGLEPERAGDRQRMVDLSRRHMPVDRHGRLH